MKRKQAIKAVGGIAAFSILGYKFYSFNHGPDYDFIVERPGLLSELVELVIPRTDTPGAKDAGVDKFIITAVRDLLPKKEKNTFIDGVKKMDSYCLNMYGKKFEDCSGAGRISALKHVTDQLNFGRFYQKVHNKLVGRSFKEILRYLVVVGYCTSEIGATQGLAFDFIPGSYHACVPLNPSQRSWAVK